MVKKSLRALRDYERAFSPQERFQHLIKWHLIDKKGRLDRRHAQKTTLGEWIKSSDRAAKILERTVKRRLAARRMKNPPHPWEVRILNRRLAVRRMKNPPHPGDLIRTEVIEALNLSLTKAAKLLKVSRTILSKLLHGKTTLAPEMASRIEKMFGPHKGHLLQMQIGYDLAQDDPA